jgi:hypothetical protein
MQSYSKTSTRTAVNLRPRFLIPETGRLIAVFFRVVVPMRSYAATVLHRPIDASDQPGAECHVFSPHSKTQRSAGALVNAALERVGIGMKMRACCQWQGRIVNVIRRRERNVDATVSVTALFDCETEGGALTEVERAAVEKPDTRPPRRLRTTAGRRRPRSTGRSLRTCCLFTVWRSCAGRWRSVCGLMTWVRRRPA